MEQAALRASDFTQALKLAAPALQQSPKDSKLWMLQGVAFAGLEKVIRERSEKSGIGFTAEIHSKIDAKSIDQLLREVEPADLIKYGLIPELIGRLPVVATLEELDKEALINILIEPKNSLIKQYRKLFEMEGATLEFREAAIHTIAEHCVKKKTGARGLRSIMEKVLLDTMYELPSLTNVAKVIVDESTIVGESKPIIMYQNNDQHSDQPIAATE